MVIILHRCVPQVSIPGASLPPASPSPVKGAAAAAADSNRPFMHEVQAARFFYMDQFVLLASGSRLHLYRYKLCDSRDDDLERLRNNNKYRLAATYASASQAIAEFSCINSFLSPLALVAGSNRRVEATSYYACKTVPPHISTLRGDYQTIMDT